MVGIIFLVILVVIAVVLIGHVQQPGAAAGALRLCLV